MNFVRHFKTPRDMQHKYLMMVYIIPPSRCRPGKWERTPMRLSSKNSDVSF